uniref:Flavin-containing monooxygenase n=1 Tax=Oncorhynchus mykiss TaxID=8022 RepID=A0A8C7W7W2_ONCMY
MYVAGPSSLTSIKSCLDEGMEPTCFESSDDIGGLWRFKEHPDPGRVNIYQSVIINSSKEMMSYSDFPPPAHLPNNMHHPQLLSYLRLYAQTFDLFNVRQRPDFPVSGQEIQVFDAVMVCTGHFTQPHLPLNDFPGIEEFEGRYFHSWEYLSAEGLQGKRVVVVGIGNSGGGIAVDASRVAEQVYLSTRKGAWVVSRVGAGGLPGDLVGTSRLDRLVQKLFPSWITMMMEKKLNRTFDHRLYGLQPKHRFFAQIPVVNDDLLGRIISGRVLVKPNIREIKGSSVVWMLWCLPLATTMTFLPSGLLTNGGHCLCLYRHVFPPGLARPSLAVVGFICNLGAINPLAEMQARWATQVFKGLLTLPSQEAMLQAVKRDTSTLQNRFACLERHPLQVDHIPYMDSMAEELGVRPNLLGLLLREPGVGLRVLLGPCTPYQYRLRGPGQWDGARQAILTQWERVAQPFRTRMPPQPESRTRASSSLILTLSVTVLLLTTFYTRHSLSSLPTGLLYKIYSLPEIIWELKPRLKPTQQYMCTGGSCTDH